MGYIGNTPAEKYTTFAKQTFTPDSSTVAFTLDYPVANENDLELFVNNVRQEPGSSKAYTAGGTTLTMSEAPTSGDDMYVIFQGKAQQTTTATLPIVDLTVTNTGTITTTTDTPSLTVNNTNDGKARITLEENGNPRLDIGLFGGVVSGTSGATVIKAYEALIFHDNLGETFRSQSGQILLGTTSEGSAAAGDVVFGGSLFIGGNGTANELDDYEEGSFTPSYSTEGGGESITYDGITSGSYIKIGQLVFVTGYIRTDGWSGGASYVYLDGLPFTINSGTADSGHIGFARANNFLGERPLKGEVVPNTTKMFLKFRSSVTGDDDNIVISDIDTGTNKNVILFSGTYRTS